MDWIGRETRPSDIDYRTEITQKKSYSIVFKRGAAGPFRQRKRLMGGFYEWLDKRRLLREEKQLREAKIGPLGHVIGRVIGLFYLFVELCGSIGTTFGNAFQRTLGRFVLEPISKWQLLAEERAARNKKLSVASKAIGGINYKIWRIAERLEKHSELIKRIVAPFKFVASIPGRVSYFLGSGYEVLEKRLQESKYFAWLYYLMYGTRVLASSAYEFSQAWFWTRNFRSLLGGVPALVMCIPLVICLVKIPFTSKTALAMQYQNAAADAWRADDFDKVRLCYSKISQLGVFGDAIEFEQARVLEKQGKVGEAFMQMKRLADHQESLSAKLWIANSLLRHERLGGMGQDARWELIQKYIDDVLRFESENAHAQFLQARLFLKQSKHDEALQLLHGMAAKYPAAATMISQAEAARGNFRGAREAIERTLETYSDPARLVSWNDHLHLARARMMMGDVSGMLDATKNATAEYHDDRDFIDALRQLYCLAFDRLRTNRLMADEQLEILEHGISLESSNREYLERLALLAEREPARDDVMTLLCSSVAEDELPLSVTYLLGLSAYKRDDLEAARRYMDRYVTESAPDATAYNNLAWLLANTEPKDFDRALKLLDEALVLDPDRVDIRETRGQVLAGLEQWTAAVKDLEFALNGQPGNFEIHDTLAIAYRELGATDLAEMHSKQAASMRRSGS